MTEHDIAQRLLDAHVIHELEQLRGPQFGSLVERGIDALFDWLGDVKLDDVVTRGQIESVIERYAIDLKVSGAFAELAGEMSTIVVSSRLGKRTRVDEVLPPETFAQFADKVAGLEPLWRELLHLVVQSDAYATLLARAVQHSFLDRLFGAADEASKQTLIEGLVARLRPLIEQRIEPQLAGYVERLVKQAIQRTEKRLIVALDVEAVRGVIDEVWDGVAPLKLSDAFAYLGSHDLEDFVVLGYEFWQRYRKSPYFRDISGELVDHFFTKYGDETLLGLLEDLGVTATMVSSELRSFLGPLLERALATDFLEQRIRAHLEPFYRSAAVVGILAAGDG
jgi:hypothetical protein